ncbi:Hypothetical protein I596_3830 [Dokdonella koreensis DS-123]|uniref:Uncharacterized protein n=1 Tax=Dokdonella koreensis DS-123 TaxID=1300342 RepID=A0A167HCI8_9GAMM|nr:Hypothetical protein I596_3830 [Dokdonella koreensis DS-123]
MVRPRLNARVRGEPTRQASGAGAGENRTVPAGAGDPQAPCPSFPSHRACR